MQALDPQVELSDADFQTPFAHCRRMYFTGVGGARIYAKLVEPRNAPGPHPAVVMFHGYSANSGDWFNKLPYAAMGFSVAALDCRGQGGHITAKLGGFLKDCGHIAADELRGVLRIPLRAWQRVQAGLGGAVTAVAGAADTYVRRPGGRAASVTGGGFRRTWRRLFRRRRTRRGGSPERDA